MIYADLGYGKAKQGTVGIEIEVEGKTELPFIEDSTWTSKKEDSLRYYGMEYINTKPMKLEGKKEKIKKLCDKINEFEVIKDSPRTSVHVHVNVSNYDVLHIYNAMCAFWIFESLLAAYCGEDREGNLFCLRLKDAESVIDYIIRDAESKTPFANLTDKVRYAGLNTNAVRKFGSLEIRLHGGSTDPDVIDEWSTEMATLIKNAGAWTNPEKLFDSLVALDKRTFMSRFFSDKFCKKLREVPNWTDMIDESAAMVCVLAYYHDWDKWIEEVKKMYQEKPKIKAKKTPDEMYQEVLNGQPAYTLNFTDTPPPQPMWAIDTSSITANTTTWSDDE